MNSAKIQKTVLNPLHGLIALLLVSPGLSMSQVPIDENGVPLQSLVGEIGEDSGNPGEEPVLTAAELEELAGPVALYPDDLLAIVLPASTYPLEIVQAARFLEQLSEDASLEPDESWDESVTALLNYPEVIRMLDEDIDWTWRLGEAVISQQEDLIAAIESFRDRAYAAGNLKSDEYQKVSNDEGVIEIVPVDEEIIYVPYYEPEEVVVYQPQPVYYYYPQAYPVYYYPYPAGHRFSSGYFWGVTTAFSIGWHNDFVHVYHPSYWGHPYYGRTYYSHYYRRPSINVYNTWYVNNGHRNSRYNHRDGDYWRPRHRSGARPQSQRVRNRHYPSGGGSQNRNDSPSSRSNVRSERMQVRENGSLQLGLRERSAGVSTPGTSQRRTAARRNTGDAIVETSRRTRPAAQRQDRETSQRSVNTSNQGRTTNRTAGNAARRTVALDPEISFRERQSTGSVRTNRPVNRQQIRQPAQQRRAPSANNVTRATAPQRTAIQRQRPANNVTRSAPTTRQPAARAAAARPAASSRRQAPVRQPVQRSPNRSNSRAAPERKATPTRSPRKERKRN